MDNPRTYPTRMDRWLLAMLVVPMLLLVGLAIWLFPKYPMEAWLCLGTILFSAGLTAALGYPCTYTLLDDHLLVRAGLVRWLVPYQDITSVEPSRSAWSGPAWSLQRVKISYGNGKFMLVSPREREAFMADLQSRLPAPA